MCQSCACIGFRTPLSPWGANTQSLKRRGEGGAQYLEFLRNGDEWGGVNGDYQAIKSALIAPF